ncbi:MAG: hypothetical protein ACI4MB_01530 [Candidatus Coproplasma sp.]
MNYTRIGQDGKKYFYYGLGQAWKFERRGVLEESRAAIAIIEGKKPEFDYKSIKIERCELVGDVQYYYVEINGISCLKPMSAARLHFILNSQRERIAETVSGELVPLPKQGVIAI